MELNRAVAYQHLLWKEQLKTAKVVVDATCGNGNDSLYLLKNGQEGMHLFAMDIQEEAIRRSKELLEQEGISEGVIFLHVSHEEGLAELVEELDLVVFNLGYLPKSDHRMMTEAETTISAIQVASEKLSVGGIITIIAYPGTEKGKKEKEALEMFLHAIPQKEFHCWRTEPMNQVNEPPILYVVQKRA